MFQPPIDPLLYALLNLHCFLGGIAAIVAYRKGRKLSVWLPLGLIGGPIALVAALTMKSKKS